MPVGIDDRRHHGLAGKINARRAGRNHHLAVAADHREAAVLDNEGGILDGAAIAHDEAGAFEHRHGGAWRLGGSRPREGGGEEQARSEQGQGPALAGLMQRGGRDVRPHGL